MLIGGIIKEGCCVCYLKSVWDFSRIVLYLNVFNDGYLEGNKFVRNIYVNFVKENL